MKFSVHVASIADCPALATVAIASFKDDPVMGYLSRSVPSDVFETYHCQEWQQRLQQSSLNGLRVFKAVDDDTGDIVAVARWQFPYSLSAEQQREKEELQKATSAKPEGYNEKLYKEIIEAVNKNREKWVDSSKDFALHGLSVSPTHQRRGLGSLLLREGLAVADQMGAKTFLESSPAGVSLYSKHGFKQIDDILMDMRPYGGPGIVSEECMMREPGGR